MNAHVAQTRPGVPPAGSHHGRRSLAPVLVLKGELKYTTARPLRAFIDEFVAADGVGAIVIDLRELTAIDSTGMGLLARIGRTTIERGCRSVIVCANEEVTICLRSAAFDKLCILQPDWPHDEGATIAEVPLKELELESAFIGRFMLEAHQELASLSKENEQEYADVISALKMDLDGTRS